MFPESEINGEVMIDIEISGVSCECATKTVEIRVMREKEAILTKECGNDIILGSSNSPALPNSYLLLENIVSFDPHNMYSLLYSTLQDPILCRRLSVEIASEAERGPGPLSISLDVTLTPQRFVEVNPPYEEVDDTQTCAICLVEERSLSVLPNCRHVFHDYCMNEWICFSNTCPLCRADILSDDE